MWTEYFHPLVFRPAAKPIREGEREALPFHKMLTLKGLLEVGGLVQNPFPWQGACSISTEGIFACAPLLCP